MEKTMETFQMLDTEQCNPATRQIDRLSTLEMVQLINQEDHRCAEAVSKVLPEIAKCVDVIEAQLRQGGRLFYAGAGTSGRLGVIDAAECPPTYGVPSDLVNGLIAGGPLALLKSVEGAEDSREMGKKDLVTLKDIPFLQKYVGTLIHDHETAMFHFGQDHAECNVHLIRYLRANTENTGHKWSSSMISLLLEMNHPGTLGIMAVSGVNLVPEGIVPEFIEEYTQINEKEHDPLITLMLTEPHIDPESLREISIPVLVTAGENDLILPSETDRIYSNLPDAELVIVEGADHGSYIVESEIMGNLLLDFFARRWEE